jgi:Protein of unknown function (DUF1592)/Protein of unknown function (DUF1588)/Protein of unknown function (DUF1595)/Protein of unknown function (DUF1585)
MLFARFRMIQRLTPFRDFASSFGLCLLLAAGCVGDIGDGEGDSTGVGPGGTVGPDGVDPTIGATDACSGATLVPARVRKITDEQYARLVTDLLPGVMPDKVATPGTELALIKDADEFIVRGPLASQYWDGALSAAKQAVTNLGQLVPCSPLPTDAAAQRACAQKFIDAFGQKAFRRPMQAEDSMPLLQVYDTGALTSFSKGIELVIAATLQSADFLYRTELGAPGQTGGEVALAPYEVASVLSFVFLGGAPDAELYASAQAGTLASDQGVADQVARLLAVPAVKERVTGLVTNIVGADQALTSQRDAKVFPELDTPLRQAMADEVHEFVQSNVFGQRPLADLFTSRQAMVNDKLASLYGVSHAGAPSAVQLPADQRTGILTRGATLLSLPTGSRSVHRGLFIANNYLCRVLLSPPANLQAEITQTLALGLNERQVSELRASKPTCSACHSNFDSLGLAFEHYDFIGKYLTERDGAPVDAHGTLNNSDVDGPFKDVVELSDLLAKSKDVAVCMPQRLAAQALGRKLGESEICSIRQLVDPWTAGDKQLGALVPLMAKSHFFLHRAKAN